MVMANRKGFVLKCEECGHEDIVLFEPRKFLLKKQTLKLKGSPCPKCGGKMKVDSNKVIKFDC